MVNFSIKNISSEDLDEMIKVESKSFSDEVKESEGILLERASVFRDGFLVVKDNNRLVGYISSEIWDSKKIRDTHYAINHSIKDNHTVLGDTLYISSIVVLPECRRNGLGNMLLEGLIEDIKTKYAKVTNAELIVSEGWKNAINLYQRTGFAIQREIIKFFDKENGLIMRKEFY